MNGWQKIETFDKEDNERVDLWVEVPKGTAIYGKPPCFRIIDAWRTDGKFFYAANNDVWEAKYVTHWMAPPSPPQH